MSSDTIDEVKLTEDTEKSDDTVADEADDADDKADVADEADDANDDADEADVAADDKPRRNRLPKVQLRPARPWRWVAVIIAAAVIAAGVFEYLKYRSTADQLAALRQTEADRDAVAKLAKEYALKSLTYSFEDPDAFFRSVEGGVSQSLKDKYVNATDILKAVMLQAQVTSSGEVLATDPVAQPGQVYQVVVSAAQTTRNLQNPKPRLSLILLQITVNKVGDSWQVSDIGPKTGSHLPSADPLAPPGPGPQPVPAPAPPPPPRR